MKRLSNRRRARLTEVAPFREAFKIEIGRCERCSKRRHLDIHEISRGPDRAKSLDKRYAILCLCRECHDLMDHWPRSKQLCLIFVRRPFDYDLDAYWILTCRRFPDHGEVLDCVEEVMDEIS